MSFSDSGVSRGTRPRSSLELKSPRILGRAMPTDHGYSRLTKSTLWLCGEDAPFYSDYVVETLVSHLRPP